MPETKTRTSRNGVEVHHSRSKCALHKGGKRCTCQRRYRWLIYDAQAKTKLRGKWEPDEAQVKRERAAKLAALESRRRSGVSAVNAAQTIGEAWHAWITGAKSGAISKPNGQRYKASTLASYASAWKKIEDEFGGRKLVSLTRAELKTWLKRQTGARSTISNLLDPLRALYRAAVDDEQIEINPTLGVKVQGSKPDRGVRAVELADAEKLIAALPEADRALWSTAFFCGLRRSELRALRCSDIDFKAGVLVVRRAWTQYDKAEDRTKTKAGERRVGIASVAEVLKAHVQREGRSGDDLVFGRTTSDPFVPSTVRDRARAAWKAAGLLDKAAGLHDARHSAATYMIAAATAQGVSISPKNLCDVMGHSSVAMTYDLYGDSLEGAEKAVGDSLAAYRQAA
jgi:integrase